MILHTRVISVVFIFFLASEMCRGQFTPSEEKVPWNQYQLCIDLSSAVFSSFASGSFHFWQLLLKKTKQNTPLFCTWTHIADPHGGLQTSAKALGSRNISLGCLAHPPLPLLIWVSPHLNLLPPSSAHPECTVYSKKKKNKWKDFLSWWNMQNLGCFGIGFDYWT